MGFPQYMALIWPYTFLQYNCYMGAQYVHHKTKSGMGLETQQTKPPALTCGSAAVLFLFTHS